MDGQSPGGGAGGGAVLIASSTRIIVNGTINANGGSPGSPNCVFAGGGSGGAIRLVSNSISGTGTLTAVGGTADTNGANGGTSGRVRLEAFTITAPSVSGPLSESIKYRLGPVLLCTSFLRIRTSRLYRVPGDSQDRSTHRRAR